jgi:gas vesicle protein
MKDNIDIENQPSAPADDELRMQQTAWLFMFACGALAGAAIALMFAPTTGRETRGWIRDRTAAAGRRTAEFVRERNQAVQAIIRKRGVLGLVNLQSHRQQIH